MYKILDIYTSILKEHLSSCFENQQNIHPIELNQERFKTKAVFMAAVIFIKNTPTKIEREKIVSSANQWFKNTFADENLFSSIIDDGNDSLIHLMDKHLCSLQDIDTLDIATLYETLLSIETGNENTGTQISTGKNYRNKLGSYYTPVDLAKSVTQKTIDTFFDLNYKISKLSTHGLEDLDATFLKEITSISFADFSCGAGNFLIEIINYFENLFEKLNIQEDAKVNLLTSVALNISAFDVDCLALEVAKLNMLLRIKQPNLYKIVSDNFIHANFLLQSNSVNESQKLDIFSSGFIYHEQLSLNINQLKKYDIVLGNPPWEKIRFEEKKFYALYSNTIADNHFKSSRTLEINETEINDVELSLFAKEFKFEIEKAKLVLKKNSFFDLSNNGELNTYALFTDAAIKLKTQRGVIGLVLKSAVVTSQVNQILFKYLTKENKVVAIYDFINRKKIFNIDSRERFCFLLLGHSQSDNFNVSMNLSDVSDIDNAKSVITLSYNGLKLLNPFTGMLPNFSTKEEADFLLRVSYDFPFFKNVYNKVRFGRIVHFTSHAEFISKQSTDDNIPIYEGKFFNQYDGKYSGFNGVSNELRYGNKSSSVVLNDEQKKLNNYFPESRFFINREKWLQLSKNYSEKFMLVWRSLTSATNTRTCIATLLPFIPASQSVQFLTTNQKDLPYLTGLFNSVVFDFILKKKLSGIDLTQSVLNQIPVPNLEDIAKTINFKGVEVTFKQHISTLVFLLLKNDARLNPLFETLKLNPQIEIKESRFEIIRKIDLLFMFLYNLNDLEIALVLGEFSKQYEQNDRAWFENELKKLRLDNSVSSSSRLITAFCPV